MTSQSHCGIQYVQYVQYSTCSGGARCMVMVGGSECEEPGLPPAATAGVGSEGPASASAGAEQAVIVVIGPVHVHFVHVVAVDVTPRAR